MFFYATLHPVPILHLYVNNFNNFAWFSPALQSRKYQVPRNSTRNFKVSFLGIHHAVLYRFSMHSSNNVVVCKGRVLKKSFTWKFAQSGSRFFVRIVDLSWIFYVEFPHNSGIEKKRKNSTAYSTTECTRNDRNWIVAILVNNNTSNNTNNKNISHNYINSNYHHGNDTVDDNYDDN